MQVGLVPYLGLCPTKQYAYYYKDKVIATTV
jgi:hypothetical protein